MPYVTEIEIVIDRPVPLAKLREMLGPYIGRQVTYMDCLEPGSSPIGASCGSFSGELVRTGQVKVKKWDLSYPPPDEEFRAEGLEIGIRGRTGFDQRIHTSLEGEATKFTPHTWWGADMGKHNGRIERIEIRIENYVPD